MVEGRSVWRVVVIALSLALALAAGAFFGASVFTEAEQQPVPSPILDDGIPITVGRGDIRSTVVLNGAVQADAPISLLAPADGKVTSLAVEPNSDVGAGDTVAELSGGEVVTTPVDGIVTALVVVAGQDVAAGEALGTVAPATFHVAALVAPEALYRLYDAQLSIQALIDRGPAPFNCPLSSLGAEAADGGNPSDAPVLLRCQVPDDVRAFSGVPVTLAVETGRANNVVIVPVSAVAGRSGSGVVTLLEGDERFNVTVELGITDGANVEVRSGLTEGQRILDLPNLNLPVDQSDD